MASSPSPMNAGNDICSYSKNSQFQENGSRSSMDAIKEIILQSLDVKRVLASSGTFTIADLGCSTGPNTFFAVQNIIEAVESKWGSQGLEAESLEFQVLFNDLITNDFNTLFASLPPNRRYFAAGVPASFHGRLFPSSSVHFAYSAFSLHWLSKAPKELQVRDSPAWNAGKITYMGAPEEVVNAYAAQFEKDMDVFLSARAQEIVPGGMMVILVLGTPEGVLIPGFATPLVFLGSILMQMVQEGFLDQDQVDTFNILNMYPALKELTRVLEKCEFFSIEKVELQGFTMNSTTSTPNLEMVLMHVRAVFEGTFVGHFGRNIADEMFRRAMHQKENMRRMNSSSSNDDESGSHLFVVLKRK